MVDILWNFFSRIVFILLQLLIPKEANSIVVTTNKGRIFGDNSKSFFLYAQGLPDLNVYLLTKNKSLYEALSIEFPGKILYAWSVKGVLKYVKAKVIMVTHGPSDVHPYYPVQIGKTFINLWHGTPMKKTNYLLRESFKIDKSGMDFCNYTCTSSEFTQYLMSTQFQKHVDNVWITGQPRNDSLFNVDQKLLDEHPFLNKKTILYAPTFRANEKTNLFPFDDFDPQKLLELLEEQDAYLMMRCHMSELSQFDDDVLLSSDRVIMADQKMFASVEGILRHTDILITDYSSIYFDFLLLNRPIVFLPYDLDLYTKNRGLNFDFETNAPGTKPKTFASFTTSLNTYFNNPSTDEDERIRVRNKFNKFTDDQSGARIVEKIKALF
jgi:CDP-glycerol glycerophosphotransferase (TagB/SpsB family)